MKKKSTDTTWDRTKDLYCKILIKFEISRQIFEKYSNVIFHENPSSGSRVVPCEQTDGNDDAYCSLAGAPKNCAFCPHCIYVFCVYTCFRTYSYFRLI